MTISALKRATAWLLALMVALVVAPGLALADTGVSTMADGEGDAQDDYVALTVSAQYADEAPIVKKEFKRSDLEALAAQNTETLYYAYAKGLYAVDKYVTIDQIVSSIRKFSITDQDMVVFATGASGDEYTKATFCNAWFAADGVEYPGFATVGKFFPGIHQGDSGLDFSSLGEPKDAPAVIGLSYASGSWSSNPAGADCAELSPQAQSDLRLFSGTSEALVTGENAAVPAGKITPSGITGMIVKTPASDAFTVYSQEGASGEPKVAKEYTRAALEALATDGAMGFLFGGDTWSVGVTTKSIAIEALLKDAGLTLEEGDSLVFAAPDGFKSTFTYDAIQSGKYFYPATAEAATDASNPVEVGTVLALNWKTAAVAGTAGVTMTDLAAGTLTNQYRVFCGLSEANYLAKEGIGGNRFATDPKSLTIIKVEKADEPTGGDAAPAPAAAVPAAQTVTAKAKTIALKAKALKKKAQTIKAAKVTKGNKAKTKLTYKLVKANKSKAKFKVASSGKITVKKGLKKGTYKLTIKATAASSAKYKQAVKKFVVTIKVK